MTLQHVPNTMTGDNIGMLYYGTSDRSTVMEHGIVPDTTVPDDAFLEQTNEPLVFLTPDPIAASQYGDVVRVDATQQELTVVEGTYGKYYVTRQHIPPTVLTVVSDVEAEIDLLEFVAADGA